MSTSRRGLVEEAGEGVVCENVQVGGRDHSNSWELLMKDSGT